MELTTIDPRKLTSQDFQDLAEVPPEVEWFANITNPNTRKAYERDVRDFCQFVGIGSAEEMRLVTRAHVIAWRDDLTQRSLSGPTIRRKLAAISSLFDHLCDQNAILHNPVNGVKRPNVASNEGKSPVLSDAEASRLLEAPPADTLKGKRDRAILSTLLYHGIRREELCKLRVNDIQSREGVMHFRVHGKGDKIRYIPVSPLTQRLIAEYLDAAGHREDLKGPLFRPVRNSRSGDLRRPLSTNAIYTRIVRKYAQETGLSLEVLGLCVHSMRATAATNSLAHGADIAKVQEWLGHANISTTRLYDRRNTRPEESPTFRIKYK